MKNGLKTLGFLLALGNVSAAAAQDALTGTWAVIVKNDGGGTCLDNDISGTWQWLVGIDASGQISIQVIGRTNFPNIYGQFGGKDLTLEGIGTNPLGSGFAKVHPATIYSLRLDKFRLVGKRIYLGSKPNPAGGGTVLCMATGSVTAQQLMGQTADSERAALAAPTGPGGAAPAVIPGPASMGH